MKKVAITCGDPAGVGPEIILRWVRENPHLAESVAIIGGAQWLAEVTDIACGLETVAAGERSFQAVAGNPSRDGATIAYESLLIAAQGCRAGIYRGVVTGPISKVWMREAGFSFIGQTEFFAEQWGGTPTWDFAVKS